MSPRALIERAIRMYGSEAALGRAIGYTQNGVHQAKRRGQATWEMATLIHHVTGGAIDKYQLCPDMRRRLNGRRRERRAGRRG